MDKRLTNFYTKNAQDYVNQTNNIRMGIQYDLFEKYLPKQARVLDCGFASGRDTLHFMGLGCEVFAIDIIPEFVDIVNEAGLKNAYLIDFMKAPYDNFFDAVWMNDFLPMFKKEEYPELFEKLASLLRSRGVVYIATRSSANVKMNGDVRGLSYFSEMGEINNFASKKFEILQMVPFVPQNSPLENNLWFQYILRKKE